MEPQIKGQTKTKLVNREVIGAVDTAVSEALFNYLEEHPAQAKAIVEKVIIAATARHAARKARELVQRKSLFREAVCPGSWPIARRVIPRNARYSLSRVIRQAVRPNRVVTACSKRFFRCAVRY